MAAVRKPKKPRPLDYATRPTSTQDTLAMLDGFKDCGIDNLVHARVYLLIAVHGPRTISRVAHDLGMPMSTASRACWELHSRFGLLNYQPNVGDRRTRIVELAD